MRFIKAYKFRIYPDAKGIANGLEELRTYSAIAGEAHTLYRWEEVTYLFYAFFNKSLEAPAMGYKL